MFNELSYPLDDWKLSCELVSIFCDDRTENPSVSQSVGCITIFQTLVTVAAIFLSNVQLTSKSYDATDSINSY